ncbi:hypothetical protein [Mycolicibacterium peregrinum]|uniref:hypothetical protein n=1 Tax=Mycolicibacterium peregrinum TaxID=43304 RepID=UPI000A616E9B|nr:hypothetical protein [Mycolicibacterium peregrinum]
MTSRSVAAVDAELRVLAAYRVTCAATGDTVQSTTVVDRLLDERLGADLGVPREDES